MSTKDNPSNRRGFPRIHKEAAIEISKLTYPLNATSVHKANLRNITPGGICCTVPVYYTVGEVLSLKIILKGWNQHRKGVRALMDAATTKAPLTVIGKVVWCKPIATDDHDSGYEIGISLTNVYEDDQKALIRYLEALLE